MCYRYFFSSLRGKRKRAVLFGPRRDNSSCPTGSFRYPSAEYFSLGSASKKRGEMVLTNPSTSGRVSISRSRSVVHQHGFGSRNRAFWIDEGSDVTRSPSSVLMKSTLQTHLEPHEFALWISDHLHLLNFRNGCDTFYLCDRERWHFYLFSRTSYSPVGVKRSGTPIRCSRLLNNTFIDRSPPTDAAK